MAAKSEQTQPKLPFSVPSSFDDDLAARCFPLRFRKIGSPYTYLSDIGIGPIVEYISKGHLLIEVAEATAVPLLVLRKWVEHEGYFEEVEAAETHSADGYLSEARRHLKHAPTEFELRRAREMLKHAEWMAEKKNKPLYGTPKEGKGTGGGGVTYQITINGASKNTGEVLGDVIEATATRIPKDTADDAQRVVFELPKPMPLGHLQPVLVMERPQQPTAQHPDIGPFYDDPLDQENTELPND